MSSIMNAALSGRIQRVAQARAIHEHQRGESAPVDDVWELRNARELFEALTGEKYPQQDDLFDFMEQYESAYDTTWGDLLD